MIMMWIQLGFRATELSALVFGLSVNNKGDLSGKGHDLIWEELKLRYRKGERTSL